MVQFVTWISLRISHGYCKTSMPKISVVFVYNYSMKNSLRNSVSPVIRIFDEIVWEWTSNSTSLYREDPPIFIGINKSLFLDKEFNCRIQIDMSRHAKIFWVLSIWSLKLKRSLKFLNLDPYCNLECNVCQVLQ